MRENVGEQGMTPRMSNDLNHLLPFNTLMIQIKIKSDIKTGHATSDIKTGHAKKRSVL